MIFVIIGGISCGKNVPTQQGTLHGNKGVVGPQDTVELDLSVYGIAAALQVTKTTILSSVRRSFGEWGPSDKVEFDLGLGPSVTVGINFAPYYGECDLGGALKRQRRLVKRAGSDPNDIWGEENDDGYWVVARYSTSKSSWEDLPSWQGFPTSFYSVEGCRKTAYAQYSAFGLADLEQVSAVKRLYTSLTSKTVTSHRSDEIHMEVDLDGDGVVESIIANGQRIHIGSLSMANPVPGKAVWIELIDVVRGDGRHELAIVGAGDTEDSLTYHILVYDKGSIGYTAVRTGTAPPDIQGDGVFLVSIHNSCGLTKTSDWVLDGTALVNTADKTLGKYNEVHCLD